MPPNLVYLISYLKRHTRRKSFRHREGSLFMSGTYTVNLHFIYYYLFIRLWEIRFPS